MASYDSLALTMRRCAAKVIDTVEEVMRFAKAFATYGATLRNVRWAYSAIANDGSLVISLWKHQFTNGGQL